MAITELALDIDLGWTELVDVGLGLLGGAFGGVLVAEAIAERTERGRRRHEARTKLWAIITEYRAGLRYKHDVIQQAGSYPGEWASAAGDERLAEAILAELPHLRQRQRARLRAHLLALCGQFDVDLAERRLHVPPALRAHEHDSADLASAVSTVLAKGAAGQPTNLDRGLLAKARNDGFRDQGAYDKAIKVLDEVVEEVKPGGDRARLVPLRWNQRR